MVDFKTTIKSSFHVFGSFFSWRNSHTRSQAASLLRFRDDTDTPHSVGLRWTRDRPVADSSTWQHTTFTRDKHPYPRRDSNPQSEQASCRRHALDRAATGIDYIRYIGLPVLLLDADFISIIF